MIGIDFTKSSNLANFFQLAWMTQSTDCHKIVLSKHRIVVSQQRRALEVSQVGTQKRTVWVMGTIVGNAEVTSPCIICVLDEFVDNGYSITVVAQDGSNSLLIIIMKECRIKWSRGDVEKRRGNPK